MGRYKEILRDAYQAIKRKDINWVVSRLYAIDMEINECHFVRMVILSQVEKSNLWQTHKKFSGASWQIFLRQVWPGMSNDKFQNAKRLLGKFGEDVFMKYGYDRLVAVARFGGFEDEILKAVYLYSSKKGKMPSTATVASIGRKVSGNKLAVAKFSSPVYIAKSETGKLRKDNARLRRENALLIRENDILKRKLRILLGKQIKDLD